MSTITESNIKLKQILILLTVIQMTFGVFMSKSAIAKTKLENFDELFVGHPIDIEKNLKNLLPEASKLDDKSIYAQILSQIAVAQAMQQKISDAHQTLAKAESSVSSNDHLAVVRINLSRGRIFHQEKKFKEALPYFENAYAVANKYRLDYFAADAAHIAAMVVDKVEDKITWNKKALEIAINTKDQKVKLWLGTLYNNIGQNYLEAEDYQNAHGVLVKALEYRQKEGVPMDIRVAEWAVAKAEWRLGKIDKALESLLVLKEEYDQMIEKGNLDLPKELLPQVRGIVYEEIAKIYQHKMKHFAKLAADDLKKDEWFNKLETNRLNELKDMIAD